METIVRTRVDLGSAVPRRALLGVAPGGQPAASIPVQVRPGFQSALGPSSQPSLKRN